MAYILIYILGFLFFYSFICFEELKNFVGEHKAMLLIGLVASLFCPILLIVVVGDFVDDYVARIIAKKE